MNQAPGYANKMAAQLWTLPGFSKRFHTTAMKKNHIGTHCHIHLFDCPSLLLFVEVANDGAVVGRFLEGAVSFTYCWNEFCFRYCYFCQHFGTNLWYKRKCMNMECFCIQLKVNLVISSFIPHFLPRTLRFYKKREPCDTTLGRGGLGLSNVKNVAHWKKIES